MESALDSVVTVDNCYVYVRECCYKLLRCKLFELDVKRVLNDIFYCSVDACIVTQYEESFLCEEEQCSCFVCYVIRYCNNCALLKVSKIRNSACVDAERLIVNCTDGYEVGTVLEVKLIEVRYMLEVVSIE